ncbi:transcription factor GTE10 [Cucumis melo var. makuwa]|uniref:Transcription factor GTE10 n=1 Tax=Cucumis melo var. makuwa TaxID=1194695 RepID=A0A5D3DA12_CUCMM|nr:transcription factor GTE10 [Cucumis melo var. makuwa]TYK20412.1 transcription factor GTE10 [Cucumis melo var. makuwa]
MYCVGKASSDRLYRAALLRNHFADTILKARENELEKRKLERQQREGWSLYIDDSTIVVEKVERSKLFQEATNSFFNTEKTLLQVQTKAPEDARRKAKAEVATTMMDGGEGWQRRWNRRRRATNGDECFSLL